MTPTDIAQLNPWQLRHFMRKHKLTTAQRTQVVQLWFKYNRITITV